MRLSRSSVRLTREGVGEASWIVSQSLAIKQAGLYVPLRHPDSGGDL